MSLLQNISYRDYQKTLEFSLYQCEIIAKLANIRVSFGEGKKPGEILIKTLDRSGISANQYQKLVTSSYNVRKVITYYKPTFKLAILIANDRYVHLAKLATPSIDCDSLASNLKTLGFVVVKFKNTTSKELRIALSGIFDVVTEDSYCFIYYAGHGCQLCNTKCMLGIDCPAENIQLDDCVTENYVLNEVAKCKPDLCVMILDMCRMHLDRCTNPDIYATIHTVEDYAVHKNLLISYSTQSSQAAYEVLQIECSGSIDNDVTYELKTGDTDRILPGASQYVNALCSRLTEEWDVSSMLDKVHEDVENSLKKQRPIKVQCGVVKRSLYDPATENAAVLIDVMKKVTKGYEEKVTVF